MWFMHSTEEEQHAEDARRRYIRRMALEHDIYLIRKRINMGASNRSALEDELAKCQTQLDLLEA